MNHIRVGFRLRALPFFLLAIPPFLTAQAAPPLPETVAPSPKNGSDLSILGDWVEIQYRYPNVNSPYGGIKASGVVTPTGVHLNLFNNDEVIVYPHNVELKSINPSSSFLPAEFNGVSVRDLSNPCAFASAFASSDLFVESNIPGFSISDVFLLRDAMFVNYQSLATLSGAIANVTFRVERDCGSDTQTSEESQGPP